MLKSSSIKVIHIEFTSKCNLKCVFCAASQPNYNGVELDTEILDKLIKDIKKKKAKVVSVNGHGETTTYKNWNLYCEELLKSGIQLHIISNFAKKFSMDEIETFSKFKSIEISCDTADPELFSKLRRGAKLETLIDNLKNLQEIGIKNNLRLPGISFSCVISDKNIFQLEDYVDFAVKLGIKHFNFCNLTKYPDIKNGINPRHITEMPIESIKKAYQILSDTFVFFEKSGIEYNLQQGLIDTIKNKIENFNSDLLSNNEISENKIPNEPESIIKETIKKYYIKRKISQTRNCLDPWSFILIQSNCDVSPCCWHPPIGSISKGQSIDAVFNNQRIQILRQSLITGKLSENCLQCPAKGWISTKNLKKRVAIYLLSRDIKGFFTQMFDISKIFKRKSYPLEYKEGWYESERDLNIKDYVKQNWRWTCKDAYFEAKKPKHNSTLILQGAVNKSKFSDQNVILKIRNQIIDEFSPKQSTFYKEYQISKQMMGNDKKIRFSIHTNQFFIPSKTEPGSKDNRELGLQIFEIYFGK